MKQSRSTALVIVVIICLSAHMVLAQQAMTVADLKTQIAQLEKISLDANTPDAMKSSSLRLLAQKRSQLRASLQMQIESLRKYQANYGSRITSKENERLAASILVLESELQKLSVELRRETIAVGSLHQKGHAERDLQVAPRPQAISSSRPRLAVQPTLTRDVASMDLSLTPRQPARFSSLARNHEPTASRPIRSAFREGAAEPPEPASIPVYWDGSRTAACPAQVTQTTTVNFHLKGINDVVINFPHETFVYKLTTKKYQRSQVPRENPFELPVSAPGDEGLAARGAGCLLDEASIVAKLNRIPAKTSTDPYLNPPGPGGASIPVATSVIHAKLINEVGCILSLMATSPDDPVWERPAVKYHPVFQWILRINGPHEIIIPVVLEPDYNYDFKIEEVWKGKVTNAGPIKATCGEKDLFTLSLGPIVSTLPSRTYSHNKALVPPGSSTALDVLTVENTRNINVLGAALLNYHLPRFSWQPPETGLALSAGPVYTLGGTPEVSALGLFVGMSVHLNRSIFLTPGVHIGEFADFPQGFAPGTVIPDQFGNLNPVKRRTAHFAFGLTYKTASFKKSGNAAAPTDNADEESKRR